MRLEPTATAVDSPAKFPPRGMQRRLDQLGSYHSDRKRRATVALVSGRQSCGLRARREARRPPPRRRSRRSTTRGVVDGQCRLRVRTRKACHAMRPIVILSGMPTTTPPNVVASACTRTDAQLATGEPERSQYRQLAPLRLHRRDDPDCEPDRRRHDQEPADEERRDTRRLRVDDLGGRTRASPAGSPGRLSDFPAPKAAPCR